MNSSEVSMPIVDPPYAGGFGVCRYKRGGCVWPVFKFFLLVLSWVAAVAGGALLARVDPATLSRWTVGRSERLVPLERPADPRDPNAEVLSRIADNHAELTDKLERLQRDVQRRDPKPRPPEPPTTPVPAGRPPAAKDYSGYRINP